jgi:predicted O-methyltransferase YrrM
MNPNPASITTNEWQVIDRWCNQYQAYSILEFGPGYSTTAFAKNGRRVVSCEGNKEFYDAASAPLRELGVQLCWYEERDFDIRIPEIDGVKFDLGFVDSPVGRMWPLIPRINTALYCLRGCRLILIHDTMRERDRMLVNALVSMGCDIVTERRIEKGLTLLSNPYWDGKAPDMSGV